MTKYAYFVGYIARFTETLFSFGMAEVYASRPVTNFDDVKAMRESLIALIGAKNVAILNYQLLGKEDADEQNGVRPNSVSAAPADDHRVSS